MKLATKNIFMETDVTFVIFVFFKGCDGLSGQSSK